MVTLPTSLPPGLEALEVPAGLGFGLMNGGMIALWRLPPFIVTLGSLTAVRGLARLTGGDTTVFNQTPGDAWIGVGSVLGISWLAVILASWRPG